MLSLPIKIYQEQKTYMLKILLRISFLLGFFPPHCSLTNWFKALAFGIRSRYITAVPVKSKKKNQVQGDTSGSLLFREKVLSLENTLFYYSSALLLSKYELSSHNNDQGRTWKGNVELFNGDYSAEIHCQHIRNKMWGINLNYTAEKIISTNWIKIISYSSQA